MAKRASPRTTYTFGRSTRSASEAHRVPVVHLFAIEKDEPASLAPFARVGPALRVSCPRA
jgi:hypothetical protein